MTTTSPAPPGDGRPPAEEILAAADVLRESGWRAYDVAGQHDEDGRTYPIRAYASRAEVDVVLVGGIHGREPAGALALVRCVPQLVRRGRRAGILVMPLLNPWGYAHHSRYGPSGQSVSDSDHLLGRSAAPACPEAAAITAFVTGGIRIRPGAAVLDLHEDPVYEAPGYSFEGYGSYLYVAGDGALAKPQVARVRDLLAGSRLPLIREGMTRFDERLHDGVIVDTEDGSIDELFARRLACTPVITVENLLHAPASPALEDRVAVYRDVLEAFFGSQAQEPPCAPRS